MRSWVLQREGERFGLGNQPEKVIGPWIRFLSETRVRLGLVREIGFSKDFKSRVFNFGLVFGLPGPFLLFSYYFNLFYF